MIFDGIIPNDRLQRRAALARPLEGVVMSNYLLFDYGNLVDDLVKSYFARSKQTAASVPILFPVVYSDI